MAKDCSILRLRKFRLRRVKLQAVGSVRSSKVLDAILQAEDKIWNVVN